MGDLTRQALVVGRDHIAATVNTLFLAYAGASLPLLILFATGIDPFGTIVTSEVVAVEVVRTLVGSVGLIAAVPLTTALAAALAARPPARSDGPAGRARSAFGFPDLMTLRSSTCSADRKTPRPAVQVRGATDGGPEKTTADTSPAD